MNKTYNNHTYIPCFKCSEPVKIGEHGDIHGTIFESQGNYGSIFDPMSMDRNKNSHLTLVICNDCVKNSDESTSLRIIDVTTIKEITYNSSSFK